jgi:S-formylglutathione hydrolase FrmB
MSIVMGVSTVAAAMWRSLWLFARRRVSVRAAVIAGCATIAAVVVTVVSVAPDPAADFARRYIFPISLMRGWLPASVQAFTAVLLVCAVGCRTRRRRLGWLPVTLVVGVVLAVGARWYVESAGIAGDPAPTNMWIWVGLTGVAVGVVWVGWRGARWWRRGLSVLAVPLCLLSCAFAVNRWVGYFPTVSIAWNQLTAGPLPDQTDRATVRAMEHKGAMPVNGVVVSVSIPALASNFHHRDELVYLPPAWFASNPPPRLPAVMMIGAEFNTPTDWLRAGNAVSTADAFAATHDGSAPVLVFVDSGGAFNIDTECVNGRRGNAADHLTKDVVPFMMSNFGVSPDRANWGVAGFSAGGTCALDLAVMHPELFSAFVDILGDVSPNAGTKAQTIARLFGGNADAWAAFDPATVISRHGPYRDVSGWFTVAGNQDVEVKAMAALLRVNGIACAVVAQPGNHDWPFAATAFAAALPWLAGQVGSVGVPHIPLPAAAAAPGLSVQAASAPLLMATPS